MEYQEQDPILEFLLPMGGSPDDPSTPDDDRLPAHPDDDFRFTGEYDSSIPF